MKRFPLLPALILVTVISASCQLTPSPASQAGTESIKPAAPALIPTSTVVRTPPALPETFQTTRLNPLDTPRMYVNNTCQYLRDKWDPNHAKPGTVVMVIMFQSITKFKVESSDGITVRDFDTLMHTLHDQGFTAINTQQLAGFLYRNENIPWRSVVLIQDGRRRAENFTANFLTYYTQWGWPVVNAWTSLPATEDTLWNENIDLEKQGWVDHQAYGVTTDISLTDKSSDVTLEKELGGSIDWFREKFDKEPIAFIWPSGSFGEKPVKAARNFGYQLGFTMNTRGPLMYNWIPLADIKDDKRPAYAPEGPINDPLMTLPRYWAGRAYKHIDEVRLLGEEATAYAEQNKQIELEYYDIVCAPELGPIPSLAP
jgi:hypothetical protein